MILFLHWIDLQSRSNRSNASSDHSKNQKDENRNSSDDQVSKVPKEKQIQPLIVETPPSPEKKTIEQEQVDEAELNNELDDDELIEQEFYAVASSILNRKVSSPKSDKDRHSFSATEQIQINGEKPGESRPISGILDHYAGQDQSSNPKSMNAELDVASVNGAFMKKSPKEKRQGIILNSDSNGSTQKPHNEKYSSVIEHSIVRDSQQLNELPTIRQSMFNSDAVSKSGDDQGKRLSGMMKLEQLLKTVKEPSNADQRPQSKNSDNSAISPGK